MTMAWQWALTFDEELGEVRHPCASGGEGHAAVEVLLRLLDVVQLEGGHKAPVVQVLDRGGGRHFPVVSLRRRDGEEGGLRERSERTTWMTCLWEKRERVREREAQVRVRHLSSITSDLYNHNHTVPLLEDGEPQHAHRLVLIRPNKVHLISTGDVYKRNLSKKSYFTPSTSPPWARPKSWPRTSEIRL